MGMFDDLIPQQGQQIMTAPASQAGNMFSDLIPSQSNQFAGQPATNGQTSPPQPLNIGENQQSDLQRLKQFATGAPNTTYGNILPFSHNDQNDTTSFDLTAPLRRIAGGLAGWFDPETYGQTSRTEAGGQGPSLSSLTTLAGFSPAMRAGLPIAENTVAPLASKLNELATIPNVSRDIEDEAVNQLMAKKSNNSSPPTSATAKATSSKFYKQAADSGDTFPPEFTNSLIDQTAAQAPQTLAGKATTGTSPVSDLANRWQTLKDKPLDMQSIQEMDEGLGDLIDKEILPNGRPTKAGKNLMDTQTNLRNMIMEADVGAGGQALQKARQAWSQSAKMSDVERIIARADPDLSDNPATTIKAGVRTLLSNPKRTRGWTEDELAALKEAGNRGTIGGLMHVFGSRLGPLIGGAVGSAGGPIGAVLGAGTTYGLSSGARNLATQMQMNRASNVLNTLGKGIPQ